MTFKMVLDKQEQQRRKAMFHAELTASGESAASADALFAELLKYSNWHAPLGEELGQAAFHVRRAKEAAGMVVLDEASDDATVLGCARLFAGLLSAVRSFIDSAYAEGNGHMWGQRDKADPVTCHFCGALRRSKDKSQTCDARVVASVLKS